MSFEAAHHATLSALQGLLALRPQIDRAGELVLETLRANRKVLVCGNGGSAAQAQHFAAELIGRCTRNRRPLPAIALSADGAALTCIGNDFGFEEVFARQIEALAQPGDLVVLLSTSGNSRNLVRALEAAHRCGAQTLALLGRDGGVLRGQATGELLVPSEQTAAVQESHLFLVHFFCQLVDVEFT